MIRLVFFLMSVSFIKSNDLSRIELQHIEINEELESNYLVVNFTQLILHRMRLVQKNPNLVRLDSLKLDQSNMLNEYFSIDLKKFRLQDENGLNKSSIILLKTSSKKLDREYLCLSGIPSCSCENECLIHLNMSAYFENFGHGITEIKLTLPILLNDLNDNKPFFYQPEIEIDLNQIEINEHDQKVTIPLKLATDLDSTEQNQVIGYELEKVSYIKDNYASISFSNDRLDLLIDLSKISSDLEYLNDKFRLIAVDSAHKAEQFILIKYKIPKLNLIKSTIVDQTSLQLAQPNKNFISIISAINDIEIVLSNESGYYEIRLKSSLKNQIFVSNKTDSLITLAYFIVEKSKGDKKMQQIELTNEQAVDSSLPGKLKNDFFSINEMRNGLYSISVKSKQYDKIIKYKNEPKIDYNLILKTKIDKEEILKYISMKIPKSLFEEKEQILPEQSNLDQEKQLTKLDIQNYLLIVSIACIVLAVFALLCFIISIMCYFYKKCKKQDKDGEKKVSTSENQKSNANIIVYDVLPHQTKSLSSSSSSSCSSSNLSPVTTTTTSVVNEQIHEPKSINPLFDTNLSNEWFQSQHQNISTVVSSPLSSSSSSNLIKTVDEVDKYKSDLHRNAQVMYKQKQLFQQNQSNYYSFGINADPNAVSSTHVSKNDIYQAKPLGLLNNSIESSSPSYSFINEVNLNSVDNLKDSIKEKMMNRLNEALTNPNLSSKSFGQISCV